ncbi:hypothetical protein Aab01nite_19400 [Paractinoplanes abujensis]|uniref:Immunity protein 50 of polymorphic toxin system n=1 Tax=Paractinoplanes abujensis TaxID=882441 RepID=A0A7W7G4A1_9ACTN|nr:Imm50 family immunity protein [Actinoplanes abujensis]MBB4697178.1 hypothetical protein [Actinoplanes abujensis]GID18350.1 hypothetical protein Aab01nite_19400 [Actinoplanes abujensis]
MTGWTQALGNPEGILAVYGGEPPELAAVHVHEVTLHRDGPSLTVTVDLPVFPARPPAKWVRERYDVVQIQLRFFGLTDVELRGFGTDPMADIVLSPGDPVRVEIVSPVLTLTASAGFVDVAGISAYQAAGSR